MLFKELARIQRVQLAKQQPITLEKARAQFKKVEERISTRKTHKESAPEKKS